VGQEVEYTKQLCGVVSLTIWRIKKFCSKEKSCFTLTFIFISFLFLIYSYFHSYFYFFRRAVKLRKSKLRIQEIGDYFTVLRKIDFWFELRTLVDTRIIVR
jgi:uncharacterized membrane protein